MQQPIAACVQAQPFSVIRDMAARAAQYSDAISLSIGEPDFHTPPAVCEAALHDALAGQTHYAPSNGEAGLRAALLAHIRAKGHEGVAQENLLITSGAMHGLLAVMRTLLDAGDEVITLAPHFSDYKGHVGLAGGTLVPVITRFEDGFLPREEALESAVTPRTRVLLINSPCNPTGVVLPAASLDMLAAFAKRHDLIVVSDEVYDSLSWNGAAESIYTRPDMRERTVVLNSFSKAYAMTGWRVGYAYGPAWLMGQMVKVLSYSVASTSTIGQRAAVAALTGPQDAFAEMRAAFGRRVALAARRLAAMPGVRCLPPSGAFYLFPRFEAAVQDSMAFALELLEATRVVVVPGFAFGPQEATRGCVRIACTVDEAKLNVAFDRMEAWLKGKK